LIFSISFKRLAASSRCSFKSASKSLNFEKNKGNEKEQHKIVSEYTETFLKYNAINNWDLVDLSAYKILGEWIYKKPTKRHFQFLNKLAKSKNIWHRRIAIISLYAFVKKGELKEMFKMCELLMKDKHDLINKAVGWMLRECGKKDMNKLKEFLTKNAKLMPRVSVRYATEHFKKENRQYF
jgi:3-methyladenine DNA glycosylase AlkD